MAPLNSETHLYYPPDFFLPKNGERRRADWVLLILNQPITRIAFLKSCMRTCGYRICADGGANRLLEATRSGKSSADPPEADAENYLPDIINGDLDSLHNDVREFYAKRGVKITLDEDQESTDFGKGMTKIHEYDDRVRSSSRLDSTHADAKPVSVERTNASSTSILVFCTISGRMDQGLGLLSEMIRQKLQRPELKLYLIGDSSFSFLLSRGENVIDFSGDSRHATEKRNQARHPNQSTSSLYADRKFVEGLFTRNVGIIPIVGPAVITTQGLEYDIKDWETNMGGKVSTSNHLVDSVVRIWTDRTVLFTVEMTADRRDDA